MTFNLPTRPESADIDIFDHNAKRRFLFYLFNVLCDLGFFRPLQFVVVEQLRFGGAMTAERGLEFPKQQTFSRIVGSHKNRNALRGDDQRLCFFRELERNTFDHRGDLLSDKKSRKNV